MKNMEHLCEEKLKLRNNIIKELSKINIDFDFEKNSDLTTLNASKYTPSVSNKLNVSRHTSYAFKINQKNNIDFNFKYKYTTSDNLERKKHKDILCKYIQHNLKHISLGDQTTEECFHGEFEDIKLEELAEFITLLENVIAMESEILRCNRFI